MALVTAENLPEVLTIVLVTFTLTVIRIAVTQWNKWRKGLTTRERLLIERALKQLKQCDQERDQLEDERDLYRRRVGQRDYLLLLHNIPIPKDGEQDGSVRDLRPAAPS